MRSGIRTIDRTLSTTRLSGSAVGIGGMANWIIPHFAPAVSEGLTPETGLTPTRGSDVKPSNAFKLRHTEPPI